ncbi:MAG: RidA family protein [Granulosicoccaceae bacterium]
MSVTRMGAAQRMSQIVKHNDTIYLAGQVGDAELDITGQTESMLAKVDALLLEAGSDKCNILQATIWLADMKDFGSMNAVWDAWVPAGHAPARACGEAALARPELLVEILVVAAAR